MIDIPLNAKIDCADGQCGESVTVIVNPTTRQVTHFVVKHKSFPGAGQVMVPVEQVVETTHDRIRLRCTKGQVARMQPFIDTRYVRRDIPVPEYHGAGEMYYLPYATPVETSVSSKETERVPAGELPVHRGTKVEATDGQVGEVVELLVDEDSGHITHLVLRKGHLWGKKEVALPVSAIDSADADTVHLKLDKQAVEQLPVIEVKRHYDSDG